MLISWFFAAVPPPRTRIAEYRMQYAGPHNFAGDQEGVRRWENDRREQQIWREMKSSGQENRKKKTNQR
jgi:hypothetical protein